MHRKRLTIDRLAQGEFRRLAVTRGARVHPIEDFQAVPYLRNVKT